MDISSQRVRIHIHIPTLWDSDELRHQECLKRLEIAQNLCSNRNDFPEAERLYREYVKIHRHWLDEQRAIEEQEDGDQLHSYDERWPAAGQGHLLSSKDSWISTAASYETKPTGFQSDSGTAATSLSAFQLPPPSVSPSVAASQNSHPARSTFVKLGDLEHPITWKGPLEATMSEKIRSQALSEATSDAERAARNEAVMRSNIAECPSTPIFPPLLGSPDILPHGEVRCIISHMPWESGKLLYCIEWKPYDVDVAPILWWIKFSALFYYNSLVNDYHHLRRLDPPKWPKKRYQKLSASLGVREIMRALEERKAHLILHGFSDEEATREVTNERWRMRDAWQRTGRGWGSAVEIVQKRRREWIEGEHLMKHRRDAIDGTIESNVSTDQPLQEGTPKQCSKPILRRGSSQNSARGKQFDAQDELEWREHFADILATGKSDTSASLPQKTQLLPSQHSSSPPPLSRVISTLQKINKRPARCKRMIPSVGDPVIISGPSEASSLNTVRLGSHSIGTKLFSGMFGKLTKGHHPTPASSPRPNTPRDSTNPNPSDEGISQTQEPQCSSLDGTSKSEAQCHVNSPGITAVDLNAPTDTEKQPKKIGSLFSFPGYKASASQKVAAYFRYNPPSAMHKMSAGENSVGKDSAAGNSSPPHEQDAPKQPENAPEAEQVHDSELWLDGTVSPTSEPSSGQNEPHNLTPVNNCSDTSSDGSDTPRASTEFENDPEDDWSGFDSGPLPSSPPSAVEEEEPVLEDKEYCVIKRPAVRELPVLLCPYCGWPFEDLHTCKLSAKELQVTTPKRPSPKKSRHLKSEVGKRKGPRLEAVQEEPGEGGGRMENSYNARVQNLIPSASAMGRSVVMKKKVPRQATDEKRDGIFERAWGGSGSERHHNNAYILARADLYS